MFRLNLFVARTLALATVALPLFGCHGVSANPFRFGNLPSGDIIRTHAKPPLFGNYGNFDPKAADLKLEHFGNNNVNQVRSQHVLIASVCDKEGNGLRNRRVEWHVSGVGHIVEVDESGLFPGRGYLVDDKYAVSYTNYKPHKITRGNENAADDVDLKPGQTYCVITSDQEGETHVTAYAPGIHDWDKHKTFVIKHWIDADAILPPSATNPVGVPHDIVTQVVRHSDKTPASGYRVRYQILDGPPAVLTAPGAQPTPVLEVPVDAEGRGIVQLQQATPATGTNRIKIEVVRPPQSSTGRLVVVASGEMVKNWVAPNLTIEKLGPELVAVGDRVEYTIRVANTGQVPTSRVTIRDTLPPSLQLVGTNPITVPQGANLVWQTDPLNPGQVVEMQIVAKALAPGFVNNVAEAVADNLPPRSAARPTRVVAGKLQVTKTAPAKANVGDTISFRVTVKNVGDGPATNIVVQDSPDPRLATLDGRPLVLPTIPRLEPNQEVTLDIQLVARDAGAKVCNTVVAKAENLPDAASAQACLQVEQPAVTITKSLVANTPRQIFVGGMTEFTFVVENKGRIDAHDVIVRDQLPPQLRLVGILPGSPGEHDANANLVQWKLGTLAAGEKRELGIKTVAVAPGIKVCNRASVVYGPYVSTSEEACIDIFGVAAFNVEVLPSKNPVVVGESPSFVIKVSNPGQTPLTIQQLECTIPTNMAFEAGVGPDSQPFNPGPAGRNLFIHRSPVQVPAGKSVIYEVRARANTPGNAKFKIAVVVPSVDNTRPYEQEQSITIYDPNDARQLGPVARATPAPTNGNMPRISLPLQLASDSPAHATEKPKEMPRLQLNLSTEPASAKEEPKKDVKPTGGNDSIPLPPLP